MQTLRQLTSVELGTSQGMEGMCSFYGLSPWETFLGGGGPLGDRQHQISVCPAGGLGMRQELCSKHGHWLLH